MYCNSSISLLNADKLLQSSEVLYTEVNFSERELRSERLRYEATSSSRAFNCLCCSISIDCLAIKQQVIKEKLHLTTETAFFY